MKLKPRRPHHNSSCLVCEKIEKRMWRIGAFILCDKHAKKVFPDGYDPKSVEYTALLIEYVSKGE